MNNSKISASDALRIGVICTTAINIAITVIENSGRIKRVIKDLIYGEPKIPEFKSEIETDTDDEPGVF